jgi:transposase
VSGMRAVYERCAGLDIHKKTVVACRIVPNQQGGWEKDIRTFGTMTAELLALSDWLQASGVTHVAMESTGIYWRPIFNILEGDFVLLLVNAQHIKFVPGRKTDVKDAQWIAELLQHGLLKPSYIPAAPQRTLRELLKYRQYLTQERTREVNRVQKVLEDANIKLASVASNVMGVSGRAMVDAMVDGQNDPATLADLAQGKLRQKLADLAQALTGKVSDSHRLLLRLHLEHVDDLNAKLQVLTGEIDRLVGQLDLEDAQTRLDAIPGVGVEVAQAILAELGTDMSRFPSAAHAASWAGLAPGKNESAGRNQSNRVSPGRRFLKQMLIQAAHGAGASKNNYLSALFRRLTARRGKKRAAIAVARTILVIAFHMLRDGTAYTDLGPDYLDKRDEQHLKRRLVKRLEQLGLKVTLEPMAASSSS